MRDITVIVFGAGATKDCNGPLTNEILPQALGSLPTSLPQQEAVNLLRKFLDDQFLQPGQSQRPQDYPALPLLLSLLDTALDLKQPLGPLWPPEKLSEVRQAVEVAIFAAVDFQSPQTETSSYSSLLDLAFPATQPEPTVISLNYDMILDLAMFDLCDKRKPESVPDYGCDFRTKQYRSKERWGKLLKIHGSVNWMYCYQCHQLELAWSRKRALPRRCGQLFFSDEQYNRPYCPECRTRLRPILITPTHRKDYRNPHLARIWYEAERALQRAKRVIFVGYSLPDDDVGVIYLLKRGLGMPNPTPLAPDQITIVEKDDRHRPVHDHPVGQRYRTLFGEGIDFRTEGFSGWLQSCIQSNSLSPGVSPPPHTSP